MSEDPKVVEEVVRPRLQLASELFAEWRDAQEKFDYYFGGLCCAVVAFYASKLEPTWGWNPRTAELLGVACTLLAAFLAIKRLEIWTHLKSLSALSTLHQEMIDELQRSSIRNDTTDAKIQAHADRIDYADELEERLGKRFAWTYRVRSWSFFLGMAFFIVAKAWEGWQTSAVVAHPGAGP